MGTVDRVRSTSPLAKRLSAVALMCYGDSKRRKAMIRRLKLRKAGGSISATLPKHMAKRLHLEAGDPVLAVETERGILLTPYDPEVEEALAVAGQVAGRYRNALRELAK
jgi:putative addiction module antidote